MYNASLKVAYFDSKFKYIFYDIISLRSVQWSLFHLLFGEFIVGAFSFSLSLSLSLSLKYGPSYLALVRSMAVN